jgi:hypothetical protein
MTTYGTGGTGGGGNAGAPGNGVAGSVNTGGGGGGRSGTGGSSALGGAGGSGIVIIAYPSSFSALASIDVGLTYTVSTSLRSGYYVYKFLSGTGNVSW